MAKARVRKPDGQKSKAPADDPIERDDGSVLPPRKPPASSGRSWVVALRLSTRIVPKNFRDTFEPASSFHALT
jgi:hypothetical protein